jgi:DedD protein
MRSAQMYEEDEITGDEAELNLGIGSLIGIFFAIALVCGAFFGFGYTLGHHNPPHATTESAAEILASPAIASSPKPSAQIAQQLSNLPATPPAASTTASATASTIEDVANSEESQSATIPEKHPSLATASKPRAAAQRATLAIPAATPTPESRVQPVGTIMVQIAAVRNSQDAAALAAALRKNGFSPSIRSESQDKLLHVQLGPFASRDDAKNMRQRLTSAGYNAFIK